MRPATRFLAFALESAEGKYRRTDRVWHCVALLEMLYAANQHGARRGGEFGEGERNKVPIEKFQVEEISALVDPIKEVGIFLDERPRMEWRLRERKQRLQLLGQTQNAAASTSASERKRQSNSANEEERLFKRRLRTETSWFGVSAQECSCLTSRRTSLRAATSSRPGVSSSRTSTSALSTLKEM